MRFHLSFVALGLAAVVLSWRALRELVALSLSADADSYILLIPVISAFLLYAERQRVFSGIGRYGPVWAVALLVAATALNGLFALNLITLPADYALSIKVASVLLVITGAFALCYGVRALEAAKFPFLMLLLMIPIPAGAMARIVTTLQWGSADASYALFRLVGVPIFRTGVSFELPIVGIEVARECSSIHSACALFITGLLVGHFLLRSLPARICLTLLTIPIAMLTNAVRIVTLWFLATKVDIGFLYGNLHRNGGIVFSLVSLSILLAGLYLLRKMEGRARVPVLLPGRQSVV